MMGWVKISTYSLIYAEVATMKCQECNNLISEDSKFCAFCGTVNQNNAKRDTFEEQVSSENSKRTVLNDIADKINRVAGIDTPVELKLREVFSNVFVKHTEAEAELLFLVGTSHTTPDIENVVDSWPKPWLFARVFILVALAYFGFYIGVDHFHNINLLPGLITIGSFMVPFTILIFFWEMNAPQNISIYKIIKMLLVGGVLSLIVALFIYDIAGSNSAIIIGIVEEAAKVFALLWFLKDRQYKFILNGLLIGAAIGAGFAAFESAGYAFQVVINSDLESMYSTIFWRGVLAPGGHIVWAALSGAALCMVKGDKKFSWSMLKDIRFLRIFGIVVALHAMWDMPWPEFGALPLIQLVLALVSWIIAFAVMNVGLKEISYIKQQKMQSDAFPLEQSQKVQNFPA
jgi:RsiW-degrading membrane proteinase PrsW (M82 family)